MPEYPEMLIGSLVHVQLCVALLEPPVWMNVPLVMLRVPDPEVTVADQVPPVKVDVLEPESPLKSSE